MIVSSSKNYHSLKLSVMEKGTILISKSGNKYVYDRAHKHNVHVFKTPFSKMVSEIKLLVYEGEQIFGMFGEPLKILSDGNN